MATSSFAVSSPLLPVQGFRAMPLSGWSWKRSGSMSRMTVRSRGRFRYDRSLMFMPFLYRVASLNNFHGM